jgi:hypothetical protein
MEGDGGLDWQSPPVKGHDTHQFWHPSIRLQDRLIRLGRPISTIALRQRVDRFQLKIDVFDSEADQLAESQAGVGQQRDYVSWAPHAVGRPGDLPSRSTGCATVIAVVGTWFLPRDSRKEVDSRRSRNPATFSVRSGSASGARAQAGLHHFVDHA